MDIQIDAIGNIDGEALSQAICEFLGVFCNVPQMIDSDSWEIVIISDPNESGALEEWAVQCYPDSTLESGEVTRVVEFIKSSLQSLGATDIRVGEI